MTVNNILPLRDLQDDRYHLFEDFGDDFNEMIERLHINKNRATGLIIALITGELDEVWYTEANPPYVLDSYYERVI